MFGSFLDQKISDITDKIHTFKRDDQRQLAYVLNRVCEFPRTGFIHPKEDAHKR